MFSFLKLKRSSLIVQKAGLPGQSNCLRVCRQSFSRMYLLGKGRLSVPSQLSFSSGFSTNQEDSPLKDHDIPLSPVRKPFKQQDRISRPNPSAAWTPVLTDKSIEELVSYLKTSFEAKEIHRFVGSYRIICEKLIEQPFPESLDLSKHELKNMIQTFLSEGQLTDPSHISTLINGLSLFGFSIPNKDDEQLLGKLLIQFNLAYSTPESTVVSKDQQIKSFEKEKRKLKSPVLPIEVYRSFQNILIGLTKVNAKNASSSTHQTRKSEYFSYDFSQYFISVFSRFLNVYANNMRIVSRKEYCQLLNNCVLLLPSDVRQYPHDFQQLLVTSLQKYDMQGRLTTEEKTDIMLAFSKLSFSFLDSSINNKYIPIMEKLFKERIENLEKLKEGTSPDVQLKDNETIDSWVSDKVSF
jgi:hypothetical protein